MTDISRDLGRVEGKLDRLIEQVSAIDRKIDGQDNRIRTVENRQYYFMGGGAVFGAIASYLAKTFTS